MNTRPLGKASPVLEELGGYREWRVGSTALPRRIAQCLDVKQETIQVYEQKLMEMANRSRMKYYANTHFESFISISEEGDISGILSNGLTAPGAMVSGVQRRHCE